MLMFAITAGLCQCGGAASAGSQVFERRGARNQGFSIEKPGRQTARRFYCCMASPASSHMFRDLMPKLADRYRVIAPDYPGYGHSDAPSAAQFNYTFERLTDVVESLTEKLGPACYSLYMQDFGGPVGFRLATRHPERVRALIVQNAVAHAEGRLCPGKGVLGESQR
jgi:pimeloyl-ACP methyl ester carboxylesterase